MARLNSGGGLAVRVTDLATRVTDLESAAGDVAFGKDTVGATASVIGSNVKMVNQFTSPANGQIPYIDVYLDGNGGTGGTQNFKGVIYSDSGSNQPDTKLGESAQVQITAGAAGAWVRFTFAAAVSVTGGQLIWMGWFSGTTGGVARYYLDGSGVQRYNSDTYSDGAASPFGSATSVGQTLSVKSVVQDNTATQIAALEEDIAALEETDTETGARLDALEAAPTGGDASIAKTQFANFPFPVDGVIESDPIEVGGDGVTLIGGAAGDQTIDSVLVLDSLDGETWRAHQGASSTVFRPFAKVRVTNGGTVQGDSEASVAVA